MGATVTEVEVRQLQGGTFVGKGPSNHWVNIDTGRAEEGHSAASGPMELLLMALGTCSGIDINLMLKKMRVQVEDLQIRLAGTRAAEPPRKFTQIKITFHFWGADLPLSKLERAVSLSQEKYCSVANTLNGVAEISTEIVTHAPGETL